MDFGSCPSHLLPNFTYFRNLLTPAAVRDTLCSGPDYAVLFLELAQHHSSRSCREHNECRQKHDFSDTQTLTELPAEGTTVQGPRTPPAVLLLHSGTFFPTSPRAARERRQVCVHSAEGPVPAMYKTITTLSTEITHCHKQSYCTSTFCRSPLFILRRWMRTSHNSHRGDKCLAMKMPVYPIKQ